MHSTTHTAPSILRTEWDASSYPLTSPARRGSGPAKLADSGVAPLVTQARGYDLLTTKEQTKAFAAYQRTGTGLITTARSLEALLHGGEEDILTMPWCAPETVYEDGLDVRPTERQYRPSAPKMNENGKIAKYAFLPGSQLRLDIHPATPQDWIEEAPQVLLNEGLLKGDSGLTAMLLSSGSTPADLAAVEDMAAARIRLREIMDRVPRSLRTLIVNAASVTGWDRHADWRAIPLRGRRAIVAFDGDLVSNANVWRETDKARSFLVHKSGADVSLLEMWSPEVELAKLAAGIDPQEKIGVDDYLTRIGDWNSLMDTRTVHLPPAPIADREWSAGDWRVSPACPAIVEELVERAGAEGKSRYWETRSRIGAKLLRVVESRMPLDEEILSGARLDVPGLHATQMVEVAFYLLGKYDEPGIDAPAEYVVTIPASALAASGSGDWKVLIEREQMRLPSAILTHEDFPMRDLRSWLGAVKGASDPTLAIAWGRQGWVAGATGDEEPFGAFVVGDMVIAETVEQEQGVVQGVPRHESQKLGRFGVEDHYRELGHAEWERQMALEVPETIERFIGAFRDPQSAAILLSMALSPSNPVRHKGSNLYFSGGKGNGKSSGAAIPMSFWGSRPRAWSRDQLPGTGSDTRPMLEKAIGRHILWVVDDLAPSANAATAAGQEDAIGQIIRSNFNNSSRSRTGIDPVPDPYAGLCVTAENLPSVPSVRERLWEVAVPSGGLLTDEGWKVMQELDTTGALRRLAGYAVRSWTNGVWRELYPHWADRMDVCAAVDEIEGYLEVRAEDYLRATYPERYAADQKISLSAYPRDLEKAVALYRAPWHFYTQLKEAMTRNGLNPEQSAGFLALVDDVPNALVAHAIESRAVYAAMSPARNALRAIASLLGSGKAHLENPTTPGAPPMVDDEDKIAAGWQMGGDGWRPRGSGIGKLGTTAQGELVAILDGTSAFTAAQREYPTLIPHGSSADAAWTGLLSEGGFAPTGVKVEKSTRVYVGDPGATTKTRRSLKGVVVRWEPMQDLRG